MRAGWKTAILMTAALGVAAVTLVVTTILERAFLTEFGFQATDVETMVAELEAGTEDRTRFGATIDGEALTLTLDGRTRSYTLPEDRFYLAVAPYVDTTHACRIHNLVTCRGELANETFHIRVVDTDGSVVFDDEVVSQANGFVGLWLPAGITGTITVHHEGLTATAALATYADAPTCMTTLALS